MKRLENKVIIVTGAASGIGAGIARILVMDGAKVVISDLNDKLGEEVARELGNNVIFIHHDVTDVASWENVIKETEKTFGSLSGLVNNAGLTGPVLPTAEISVEDYQRTINVDQHAVFLGMRAAIPRMIANGGSIVNISSIAGFSHVFGTPNIAYTAAKHAIRGMVKAATVEYSKYKIRFNSVHPGTIRTPLVESLSIANPDVLGVQNIPLGRIGEPEDIGRVVSFLLSDDSSYITGAAIPVDGGILAH